MISFRGGINLKEYNRSIFAGAEFNKDTVPNLKHWVKADDLSTLFTDSAATIPVVADGDPVGTWVDQIVDEYIQTVTAAKPTYRASVAAFSNKPVLQFDGGDYLQGAFTSALSQPTTRFVVVQLTAVGGVRNIVGGDDAINEQRLYSNNTAWTMFAGTALADGAGDTNTHIFTGEYNGVASKLYIDGVSVASGNAGTNGIDGFTIGANSTGNNPMTGYQAEILLYSALLSTADKNIVQNYLSAKYGISVTEF